MYIKSFQLSNIKGFEQLECDLTRPDGSLAGWTVLTGGNGSGKTTVLRALAVRLMGAKAANSMLANYLSWRRNNHHPQIFIKFDLPTGKFFFNTAHFEMQLGYWVIYQDAGAEYIAAAIKQSSQSSPEMKTDLDTPDIFCCGYGPFRRISGASADVADTMRAPVLERFVTLFKESASLSEADTWLRDLNYKKLEGKPQAAEQLATVLELLNDELLPNGVQIDKVDSDGLWLRDAQDLALTWHDMSDGYRSALALLCDIVRHMFKHFGTASITRRNGEGHLEITAPGVVLIDEVDAHLHPEWQREIGFWLKRHFPAIQFIVTSHSPIICQAADENGLFVLPNPGSGGQLRALSQDEYWQVVSSKSDTILRSPAFGLDNTRSPRAVAARADYADLQAKRNAGLALNEEEINREAFDKKFVDNGE